MRPKLSLALSLILVCAVAALADEPKKAPEMSAQQKAAMEAMMKAANPAEGHKLLNSMVGTFDAKVQMWMDPAAPPSVSTDTSTNQWVLGGRWVEQRFDGDFMGQKFTGLGYTGYDVAKKEYVGTWMDTVSTTVMQSHGNTSDGGKTWNFTSVATDPMTGKDSTSTMKVTVADNDHHTMEMWGPGYDGKTIVKWMQIDYTRKK